MNIEKPFVCLTSYPPQWRCERCGRIFPDSFMDRDMHVCEPKPKSQQEEQVQQ